MATLVEDVTDKTSARHLDPICKNPTDFRKPGPPLAALSAQVHWV